MPTNMVLTEKGKQAIREQLAMQEPSKMSSVELSAARDYFQAKIDGPENDGRTTAEGSYDLDHWFDMIDDINKELQSRKKKEFLTGLADLCERYDATFKYTTDDDGIHIMLAGEDVFSDYMLDSTEAVAALRAAAAQEVTK